jgi:cell division protein FtsW (lipid II flippase)
MISTARSGWHDRGVAALALLIPCLAGLAYLALFGAPASYIALNACVLATGLVWVMFGRLPAGAGAMRAVMFGLVSLLALPMVTGPEVDGITRWIRLGGFSLHIGMAVIPLIAVLSAQDKKFGRIAQLSAMLLALWQPDPATALAMILAAIGANVAQRDPVWIAFALLGLCAAAAAAFLPNLPPQTFVEQIIPDLLVTSPLTALALALSLVASIALMLYPKGPDQAPRFALAGALAGFTLASLIGNYPTPLIGYGAAAIFGFALALARRNGTPQ